MPWSVVDSTNLCTKFNCCCYHNCQLNCPSSTQWPTCRASRALPVAAECPHHSHRRQALPHHPGLVIIPNRIHPGWQAGKLPRKPHRRTGSGSISLLDMCTASGGGPLGQLSFVFSPAYISIPLTGALLACFCVMQQHTSLHANRLCVAHPPETPSLLHMPHPAYSATCSSALQHAHHCELYQPSALLKPVMCCCLSPCLSDERMERVRAQNRQYHRRTWQSAWLPASPADEDRPLDLHLQGPLW